MIVHVDRPLVVEIICNNYVMKHMYINTLYALFYTFPYLYIIYQMHPCITLNVVVLS